MTATLSALRCLFFGTDAVSLPTLQRLHDALGPGDALSLLSSLSVVTTEQVHKVRNRPVPPAEVYTYAKDNELPLHIVPRYPSRRQLFWQENISRFVDSHDIAVLVSFGHRLPASLLTALPQGCINMHPSLVPRYRGAAPIIWALMDGVSETGVSILQMTSGKFDSGPLLAQQRVPIPPNTSHAELSRTLAEEGAALLLDSLPKLATLRRNALKQDELQSSSAPKIDGTHAYIQFQSWDMDHIVRRYRALADAHPLHGFVNGKRLALLELEPADSTSIAALLHNSSWQPGDLVQHQRELFLCCLGQRWLKCKTLMFEGAHKQLSAFEFINGHLKPQNRISLHLT